VRSLRKVTLLSLFPSVEQLVVYADEKLTAFMELESAIRVAVNSRKATAINCLTTDRRAVAGFLLLCHTQLHPPEHNTW
jgi:hypothetical protein